MQGIDNVNAGDALLQHLVGFGRRLKERGIAMNPAGMKELCRAVAHIDISRKEDFKTAARATLLCRYDDLEPFDQVFAEYWGASEREATLDDARDDLQSAASSDEFGEERLANPLLLSGEPDDADRVISDDGDSIGYSAEDALAQKDFGSLDEAEIIELRKRIDVLVKALVNRPGRRYRPGRTGDVIDFRRSFRHNLRHGFAGMELKYRKRRIKKLKLVVLCDVSRSMAKYSRFFLDFVYALRHELPTTEAAVFATHMTPVTGFLEKRDLSRSFNELTSQAAGWGGGTDIGQALAEFNNRFVHEMMSSKAVVVVLSDGWDRGDARKMRNEIARLRRHAYKLVWLNPLLGTADYQPLCRGMRAALPHLDHFLPARNLASLAEVADVLQRG